VHGQYCGPGARRGLFVLQLTAGHTVGVGAVQRAGHAGGGVGGQQFDGRVGVDGLVGFDQLFHQRGDGGRTAHGDVAAGLGGGELGAFAADVAFLGGQGLAVGAHAVADEVNGHSVGGLTVGDDVERAGQGVRTVGDVVGSGFHAAHGHGLDAVVQRAQADVADGGLVVGDGGHDTVGRVLGGGGLSGHIHLLAGVVLFLHAGQLDEGAAGAGTILAGDDGDILVQIEVGSGGFGGSSFAGSRLAG